MPSFDTSSPFLREAKRLQDMQAGTKTVIERAVGTLKRRLPVEARRDIQNEYNLPSKRIAIDLTIRETDENSVTLVGGARSIGLEAFDGKWAGPSSEGASAKVFTNEAAHVYGGTFMAVGRNGNRQIFSRTVHKGSGAGSRSGRLPIRALYGPKVASMLRKGERESRLADFVQVTLAEEINRLLKIVQP